MDVGNIYGLTCLCHGEIRYVGLTTKKVSRRLSEHLWEALRNPYLPKHSWMLKHGVSNIYAIELEIEVPLPELGSKEVLWISLLKEDKLLNMTLGGEGNFGYKHSEESKLKMSLAKTGTTYTMSKSHKDNVVKAVRRRYQENMSYKPLDGKTKLTYDLADEIRFRNSSGESQRSLSREFKVSLKAIQNILHGLTYNRPYDKLKEQYRSDEA